MLFPPRVSVTKVWVVGGGQEGAGLTLHLVCRLNLDKDKYKDKVKDNDNDND